MTRLCGWLVATLAVAASLVVPLATPSAAHAAGSGVCTAAGGVSVVVDFGGLGGGVSAVCDTSGDTSAQPLFEAHHDLTYTQRYPGVVCRIDSAPSSAPCVNMPPTTAYWGLWWSDGKDGTWHYSTVGVDSLSVPIGGSVAFAWQSTSAQRQPSIAPGTPAATPTTKPSPSRGPGSTHPTSHPSRTAGPTGPHTPSQPAAPTASDAAPSSASSASSASSSPSQTTGPSGSASPSAHGTATPTTSVAAAPAQHSSTATPTPAPATVSPTSAVTSEAADARSHGGLPGWVAPGVIGVLIVAGGVVTAVRRRGA